MDAILVDAFKFFEIDLLALVAFARLEFRSERKRFPRLDRRRRRWRRFRRRALPPPLPTDAPGLARCLPASTRRGRRVLSLLALVPPTEAVRMLRVELLNDPLVPRRRLSDRDREAALRLARSGLARAGADHPTAWGAVSAARDPGLEPLLGRKGRDGGTKRVDVREGSVEHGELGPGVWLWGREGVGRCRRLSGMISLASNDR